jgi:hypothetical protein
MTPLTRKIRLSEMMSGVRTAVCDSVPTTRSITAAPQLNGVDRHSVVPANDGGAIPDH